MELRDTEVHGGDVILPVNGPANLSEQNDPSGDYDHHAKKMICKTNRTELIAIVAIIAVLVNTVVVVLVAGGWICVGK